MSRIHEALKKAAQERSSQVATGTVPDLADVATGLESPFGNKMQAGEPSVRSARVSEGSSSPDCDDPLRRCAHPNWHLAPRLYTSLKTDDASTGRGRYPTLSSTPDQISA